MEFKVIRNPELYHHGIKGQKWGIQNGPPYPLKEVDGIRIPRTIKGKSKNGITITGLSDHAKQQMGDSNRKVKSTDIVDAFKNPLYINPVKVDEEGRKSQVFIGNNASVAINTDTGIISTVWRTGKRYRNKYKKEQENVYKRRAKTYKSST